MPKLVQYGKVQKLSFASQQEVIPIPNLIDVQRDSYNWFLQAGPEDKRDKQGLHGIFLDIFPIQDVTGNLILEYINYSLGLARCKKCPGTKMLPEEPCLYSECPYAERTCEIAEISDHEYRVKHSSEDCRKRDSTFNVPLQLRVRLINKTTGEVKEQEIFLVSLPIMTERGTFIINGAERVVVSQLQRSPGLYFNYDRAKKVYGAKIIPYRGAWLEWELDIIKDNIYVRIDRKRKQPVTVLLRALGYESDEEILALFNNSDYIKNTLSVDKTINSVTALKDIYAKLRPGEPFIEETARRCLNDLFFNHQRYDLGDVGRYKLNKKLLLRDRISKKRAGESIIDKHTGEVLVEPGEIIDPRLAMRIEKAGVKSIRIIALSGEELVVVQEEDREPADIALTVCLAKDINLKDGNRLYSAGVEVDASVIDNLEAAGIKEVEILKGSQIQEHCTPEALRNILTDVQVENMDNEENLKKIYTGRKLVEDVLDSNGNIIEAMDFAGENVVARAVAGTVIDEELWNALMNNHVSRIYVNKGSVLVVSDIVAATMYLIDLCNGLGHEDDIDHLANRRIRRSGELLQNQIRISLSKLEREIRDRMTIQDVTTITPQALINTRPIAAVVNDFFSSSQLSQFMDQTNPLSELTHKRRVSALGPGGVKRERAGYEVRDVHPTHYGRICPIETPEGPNAGLIASLCVYSEINDYGFIETPFREVNNKKVDDSVKYLDAYDEDEFHVSPSDVKIDSSGNLSQELLPVKYHSGLDHEFGIMPSEMVQYIRVSPKQMISIAASLIPFLEHDDANRALMGTNMQRQAVPLLDTEVPYVGTGLEFRTAVDSGSAIVSRYDGEVVYVDAESIVVMRSQDPVQLDPAREGSRLHNRYLYEDVIHKGRTIANRGMRIDSYIVREFVNQKIKSVLVGKHDRYRLMKFMRSNQATCINQKAIVNKNQKVKAGEVLADGPASRDGQLALGRNILVAFMSWEGYNFEDAILLSKRLVTDDLYTSIHIEEYEIEARDTRLGAEEITRDIPNVSADMLRNLDEDGIIMVGAEVEPGDILVGKVTPKGETELTAEDKLLRAIFGEKARDVRNTSYLLPHGEGGKVVDVMVFSRENKDELSHDVNKLVRVFVAQKRRILEGDKMAGRHGNKGVIAKIMPVEDMPMLSDGTPVDIVLNPLGVPSRMNLGQVLETHLGYVARVLGMAIDTPPFAGAHEGEIFENIVLGQLVDWGKTRLYKAGTRIQNGFLAVRGFTRERFMELIMEEKGDFFDKLARVMVDYEARLLYRDGFTPIATLNTKDIRKIVRALKKGDMTEIFTFGSENIIDKDEQVEYLVKASSGDFEKSGSSKGFTYDRSAVTPDIIKTFARELEAVDIIDGEMGKVTLYDGRDGRLFLNDVMTGMIYMMKLAHLVDDKIHARATGPYSLVTQQPLGGKAQFGGQRFGEMEVWALEAYGAAYTLQELLTVKSDDVQGRVEVYETIIKGHNIMKSNVPESFKVLVSELQSLGLKVELLKTGRELNSTDKPEEDIQALMA